MTDTAAEQEIEQAWIAHAAEQAEKEAALKLFAAANLTVSALRKRVAELEGLLTEAVEFIEALDGKTICIRGDENTFIDDGIVVAADHTGRARAALGGSQ